MTDLESADSAIDAELNAMRAIVAAIDPLSMPSRNRVLNWAWDRFVINPPPHGAKDD